VNGALDKADLLLGRTSTNEWAGRVGQYGPTERIGKETGKGERKLDGIFMCSS